MEIAATRVQTPWQDQILPAPLLPADLALVVTLSLLRQQPATIGAVSAGDALIEATLYHAGVDASRVLLLGPASDGVPDVCWQTDEAGAARFDELLATALQQPGEVSVESATWLRERTLAVLRLRALSDADSFFTLPEVDDNWVTASAGKQALAPPPRFARV